jgi:hypothetical protein
MRLNPAAIELAVTMPLIPSHLEKELAATLGRPGGFLTTSAAFEWLAQAASRRLVVMTPFIDAGGFRWLRRAVNRFLRSRKLTFNARCAASRQPILTSISSGHRWRSGRAAAAA